MLNPKAAELGPNFAWLASPELTSLHFTSVQLTSLQFSSLHFGSASNWGQERPSPELAWPPRVTPTAAARPRRFASVAAGRFECERLECVQLSSAQRWLVGFSVAPKPTSVCWFVGLFVCCARNPRKSSPKQVEICAFWGAFRTPIGPKVRSPTDQVRKPTCAI